MASERPPDNVSITEGPELGQTGRPPVIARQLNTDYPVRPLLAHIPHHLPTHAPSTNMTLPPQLIDSDPHFSRVLRYARPSDYLAGTAFAACGPALMLWWERISPSEVSRGGFASIMRLSGFISVGAGFLLLYSRSQNRFYGFSENRRELERDMREMTDRAKCGEPLYGRSQLTEYMQGVASRQSRYSGVFLHVMPWFNFVNHSQHGVDTAKYYQQAERELEEERIAREGS